MSSITAPKFPEDFAVQYAEGASFWWWSPTADGAWGIMLGEPEHATHCIIGGDGVLARWTSFESDGPQVEGVYDPTDAGYESVQALVDTLMIRVAEGFTPA